MEKLTNNRWAIINKIFKDNFIVAVVIELSVVGNGLVDGIVVSRMLGGEAMAAFGIAQPIFSFSAVFFGLFATGMQTMTSHELGKGNLDDCNRIFCATAYICGIFSLFFMSVILLASNQIAALLGGNGSGLSLQEGAAAYIKGLAYGMPAIFIVTVLASAIQIDSGRKLVFTSVLVDFAADITFDLLAAKLGFGLFGIGLATSLARYIRLAVVLTHFADKSHLLHFVPLKTSIKEFGSLLSMGTEKAWRRLGNVIRPIFVNKLVLLYGGSIAMTAMSVRGTICDISEVLAVGLADTVGLLAGIYYGEKNAEAERIVGHSAHRTCLIWCGAVSVLLIVFSHPIAAFYAGKGTEAAALTNFAIIGIALQGPMQALVRSRIIYLQKIMKNKDMRLLILGNTVIFPIVSALILGVLFGVYGVLWCYTAGDMLSLIAVWMLQSFKSKMLVPEVSDYMKLPEDFNVKPGDIISLDIRNMDDVSLVSEQITLFCKGHKISSGISNRTSVCFEEMASNIITHGFPLNKSKSPIIDLRLVITGDRLVMRLQDNCPKYDVAARIKTLESEHSNDKMKDLGTRIVSSLADEINYAYCYETNIVFMKYDNIGINTSLT